MDSTIPQSMIMKGKSVLNAFNAFIYYLRNNLRKFSEGKTFKSIKFKPLNEKIRN